MPRPLSYPAFRQPPHVTFGAGSVRSLASEAGRSLWLVSSSRVVHEACRVGLGKSGVDWGTLRVFLKPAGEPSAASVKAAAEWLTEQPAERVVAVGGGSVLDWARLAVAASDGWFDPETAAIREAPASRRTVALVPTTCGTGAEAAGVAVYSLGPRKLGVVSPGFIAEHVVLDGQFLTAMDPGVLRSFLSDALTHAIESYVSIVPNTLAKEAAVSTLRLLLELYDQPDGPSRNQHLMEAGYLGGLAAANCSVGVVHAFAHSIARFDVAHGVANAAGLGAGITINAATPEMTALLRRSGFATVDALLYAIGPITTDALGDGRATNIRAALLDRDRREEIAAAMMTDVCLRTNPRRLDRSEVDRYLDIVEERLPQ